MTQREIRRNARAAKVEKDDDCGKPFNSRKALCAHIKAYKGQLSPFGRALKVAAK